MHQGNILLGVTGGIAAYKSAELVRLLVRAGFQVRVVMTAAAQSFVTPLTFQALSGKPVHCDLLDVNAEAGMGHIELARWADLLLIAPASADVIARLAHGLADDLLTTVSLATQSPVAIAPAMNQAMWRNLATQSNVDRLRERDFSIWGPGTGEQACGDVGPGRMLDPIDLLDWVCAARRSSRTLAGKTVVITAGPTREPIDPVRYLTNHSTGKMGYALAEAAFAAGANVHLVSGPTNLATPNGVELHSVQTAQEMLACCLRLVVGADVFIAAAAVADFRPVHAAEQKIKKAKGQEKSVLELVANPDILASVAALSSPPFTVGFAAETERLLDHAKAKLTNKKVDMIIANDVSDKRIGFHSDENAVTVITATHQTHTFERENKRSLARKLIEYIALAQKS